MATNPTCLVVDDSDIVRRVMRLTIESLGVEVHEAATAQDAITRCRVRMPDVIVLDWHIPGSNTLDTLVSLRSLPGGKTAKILYVATNNDPVEIGRAITAGARDHMIKPFRRVTLEAKIAEFISSPRGDVAEARSDLRIRRSIAAL